MTTPSSAYPFSPTPPSPSFASELPPSPNPGAAAAPPTEERRRSKRESTASATRRREAEATRYPSPPPQSAAGGGGNRRSIDASLVIPPFNPNNRRTSGGGAPSPSGSSSSGSTTRQQQQQQQQYPQQHSFDTGLTPSPSIPAQYQSQSYSHRPVSAAVIPTTSSEQQRYVPHPQVPNPHLGAGAAGGAGGSVSSRSRQSVGYLPTSSSNMSSAGPYPGLYTPHQMPRQKIYFGPYILLQTLGEGEFGKVKLGVHSERWGEDVAIKLIKRGNVDTAQRGEKVRREIEVLKIVRHPNIVRLYDVIETEKYIGIVLEYASGGELFDHILAHRYLKEKDAAKLFAQLISGVAYLHQKGIVHRDLKLENLLLDRNRNLQMTDFGFANRFQNAEVDLMATSCGSPCYAAPELVVQEGKYIGTAVDVWSCGVILYAMLAGYLPYDDDPANPEGDNINLLYKYIIGTPLVFPDWITAEPRELLLLMLVPDPTQRCTIEDVQRHSWLARYAPIFDRSVEQLEAQAQMLEMQKRQALEAQRQFLIAQQRNAAIAAQQAAHHQGPGGAQQMSRSQTASGGIAMGPPSSGTRHRSAMVTSTTAAGSLADQSNGAFNTVQEETTSPSTSPPARPSIVTSASSSTTTSSRRHSGASFAAVPTSPTTQTQRITVDADPFSFSGVGPTSTAMIPSFSAPPDPPSAASSRAGTNEDVLMASAETTAAAGEVERKRRQQQHRATVQVEYDGGAAAARERERSRRRDEGQSGEDVVMREGRESSTPRGSPMIEEMSEVPSMSDEPQAVAQLPPPVLPAPIAISARPTTPPLVPISFPSTPPRTASTTPTATSTASTPKKRKSSNPPPQLPSSSAPESSTPPPLPTSIVPDVDATPKPKRTTEKPLPTPQSAQPPRPPSVASNTSRHKSTISADRFSLRSLLSGSTTSLEKTAQQPEQEKPALDEVTNNSRRKSRRQKAMSLQPFRHSTSSKVPPKVPKPTTSTATAEGSRTRSSTVTAAMPPPPRPSTRASTAMPPPPQRTSSTDLEANWANGQGQAAGASSGKAKAVMDWFRRRSTRGYPVVASDASSSRAPTPIATDFDRPSSSLASSIRRDGAQTPASFASSTMAGVERAPSVVVTGATSTAASPSSPIVTSLPMATATSQASSSRSASGATTASTAATSINTIAATHNAAPVFNQAKLRVHQGALDKSALTYRLPSAVIGEIRSALWSMGIDMVQEGEFKIKCVRKSKKKALAAASPISNNAGLGLSTPLTGSGFSSTSASPNPNGYSTSSLDRRSGLPTSPSLSASPSSGFRSFFGRKGSSTPLGSPSLDHATSEYGQLGASPSLSQFSPNPSTAGPPQGFQGQVQPQPVYGEGTTDNGDEVRFFVELTRVKHLEGLYCVDVKRMKGGPWSFKHVYDQLLEALELGPTV